MIFVFTAKLRQIKLSAKYKYFLHTGLDDGRIGGEGKGWGGVGEVRRHVPDFEKINSDQQTTKIRAGKEIVRTS